MVRPIEYLRWHLEHAGGANDLSTSDQHAVAGDWAVAPELLSGLSDPPDDVALDEQVAEVYGVAPEQVVLTAGTTQANLLAAAAVLGDEAGAAVLGDVTAGTSAARVLVETPGYEPLRATPEWLGATVDRFRRPPGDDFALQPERVAGAAGEDTALVVVTDRHNPSGRRADRDAIADAATAARDHDAALLVDEVYSPFEREAGPGPFGGPTAAGVEGTVVTGSLTKFFGLGGLRVGWLVADPSFVERVLPAVGHLPGPSVPGAALAGRALYHRETLGGEARDLLRDNHALLADFVADRDDLAGPVFDGATFGALAHERADGDAVAEAAAGHDCTVVPGRFFEAPDRFRVSLGGRPDEMAAALDALGDALDDLG